MTGKEAGIHWRKTGHNCWDLIVPLFKMKCPRCGYSYQYRGDEYEFEFCPICGCGDEFRKFVEDERKCH